MTALLVVLLMMLAGLGAYELVRRQRNRVRPARRPRRGSLPGRRPPGRARGRRPH